MCIVKGAKFCLQSAFCITTTHNYAIVQYAVSCCTVLNCACMCNYALYIEQSLLSNVHLIQNMPSSTCNVHYSLCNVHCADVQYASFAMCNVQMCKPLVLPSCVIVHSSGQNRDAQPQTILHISYHHTLDNLFSSTYRFSCLFLKKSFLKFVSRD